MSSDDSDNEFDLFSELSAKEQSYLDARKSTFQSAIQSKLSQLSLDPKQRTIAESRYVFMHNRQVEFNKPGFQNGLLSRVECQNILDICTSQKEWTTDRHSAFATTDIPIRANSELKFLEPLVKERHISQLANHYGFNVSDLEFRDIFIVKYAANAQRGLKLHTDGCLFSLTLLISHEDSFEGGGTYYQSIDKVIHLKQGDCAYHNANDMHMGVDITKGERYILVGFIDTVDTIDRDKKNLLLRQNK